MDLVRIMKTLRKVDILCHILLTKKQRKLLPLMRLNVLNDKKTMKSDMVIDFDKGSGDDSALLVFSNILEKQALPPLSHDVSSSFLKQLLPRDI